MLDIKQFIVYIKELFIDIVDNVYYLEIDKDDRELYPVLVYDIEYEIQNENRITGIITANLYDNQFNGVLNIEQIGQDLYNKLNYLRTYAEKNVVYFSIMITSMRVRNAPTEEENLKRKLITITYEAQFK